MDNLDRFCEYGLKYIYCVLQLGQMASTWQRVLWLNNVQNAGMPIIMAYVIFEQNIYLF